MATSEIEKLERRYAENPQGLTFAPLAEVHRKSGDVVRALELLRAGLELHPNYIPASIVLGRCHWDLGDLPAAESAFAHVLRLDDENVIALKSLADINERLERFGEAQRWLHRLVSVDRSNEEAKEQLSRLEAVKDRPRPPTPTPTPEPTPTTDLPHEFAAAEAAPAKSTPAPAAAASPPPQEPAPLDLTAAIAGLPPEPATEEAKPPALEFLDTSDPGKSPAQTPPSAETEKSAPQGLEPVPGLSTHEFVPPKENTYRLHPELTREFIAGNEPPLERFDIESTEGVELQSSGANEFRVPNAAEDFMDLAARMNSPRDAAPPPMAERQKEPPAPPPSPPPKPLSAAEPVAVSQAPERAKPSYSEPETKGQSVASFFQTLLAARPSGSSPSPTPAPGSSVPGQAGAASPSQDGLSLSPVFGQESSPNAPVPAGGQLKDAAVSFDDFFSSAGGEAKPMPPGGGDPKHDDLDSFQSWLQNLKR
ncbi:MAG TPA: tetratricopeptide repeat protein [Gemmatimonadales bacterium]